MGQKVYILNGWDYYHSCNLHVWIYKHRPRLSVHIPAEINMVNESVNSKASCKNFLLLWEKWPTKAVLNRNKINIEDLLILEFLIKQLFYSGLQDTN